MRRGWKERLGAILDQLAPTCQAGYLRAWTLPRSTPGSGSSRLPDFPLVRPCREGWWFRFGRLSNVPWFVRKFGWPRVPRFQILHDLPIEVDGLLSGVAYERATNSPPLLTHWPGQGQLEASRLSLRVDRREERLGILAGFGKETRRGFFCASKTHFNAQVCVMDLPSLRYASKSLSHNSFASLIRPWPAW